MMDTRQTKKSYGFTDGGNTVCVTFDSTRSIKVNVKVQVSPTGYALHGLLEIDERQFWLLANSLAAVMEERKNA